MARSTTPLLVIALLAAGGAAVFLSISAEPMSDLPSSPPADEPPVVRASIGARLRGVQSASTYPFDVEGRDDTSDFIIEQAVVFEYGGAPVGDSLSFRLPPTRFVWLSQVGGVVSSINTTPQLQFATLDGAIDLAQRVANVIDATSWARAESTFRTEAEIRQVFADPETRETARLTLDRWQAGTVEMDLTLKRLFVAKSNRAQAADVTEDSYLVEVGITDVDLDTEMAEKVYARRRAAGDEHTPLPLSVWLDEQD